MNKRFTWNLIGFILASVICYASTGKTEWGWSIITLITGITAIVFIYRTAMSLSSVESQPPRRS